MFKKISALILSSVLLAGMTTAFAEEPAPVQTAQTVREYAAKAAEWNGKTALKSGKSYVVTKDLTISKDVTVPKGAKLTIKNGAKLSVGAKGSLTINGTVTVGKGSTLAVSGALTQAKGKKLVVSGTVKLGKKSALTLNGSVTLKKGGVISGEPKTLNLGKNVKFAINGKLTSQKLLKAYDSAAIMQLLESLEKKVFIDGKAYDAYVESYPAGVIAAMEEEYAKQLKELEEEFGYSDDVSFEEAINSITSYIVSMLEYQYGGDITGVNMGDLTITYMDVSELPESVYAPLYGTIERAADVSAIYTLNVGDQTTDPSDMGGIMVYSGGRWYLYAEQDMNAI